MRPERRAAATRGSSSSSRAVRSLGGGGAGAELEGVLQPERAGALRHLGRPVSGGRLLLAAIDGGQPAGGAGLEGPLLGGEPLDVGTEGLGGGGVGTGVVDGGQALRDGGEGLPGV